MSLGHGETSEAPPYPAPAARGHSVMVKGHQLLEVYFVVGYLDELWLTAPSLSADAHQRRNAETRGDVSADWPFFSCRRERSYWSAGCPWALQNLGRLISRRCLPR